MRRVFTPRKLLVASIGVATISYGACEPTATSPIYGNLMGPQPCTTDADCADAGVFSFCKSFGTCDLPPWDGGPLADGAVSDAAAVDAGTCCAPWNTSQCGFPVASGICNACCQGDACGLPPQSDGGCFGVLPCPDGSAGLLCRPVDAGSDADAASEAGGTAKDGALE